MARSITKFPIWLEGFNRLKTVIAEISILYNKMDGDSGSRYQRTKDSIMDRFYEKTGVCGQYVGKNCRVGEKSGSGGSTRERMDWSQHLGSIWKRPSINRDQDRWVRNELPWDFFDSSSEGLGMKEGQFCVSWHQYPAVEW
jgi:hypothetical protein